MDPTRIRPDSTQSRLPGTHPVFSSQTVYIICEHPVTVWDMQISCDFVRPSHFLRFRSILRARSFALCSGATFCVRAAFYMCLCPCAPNTVPFEARFAALCLVEILSGLKASSSSKRARSCIIERVTHFLTVLNLGHQKHLQRRRVSHESSGRICEGAKISGACTASAADSSRVRASLPLYSHV